MTAPARVPVCPETSLRPSDRAVLAYLAAHVDHTGTARVTQRRIATDTGYAHRIVNGAVRRLRDRGLLVVRHRHHDDGGMAAAEYRIAAAVTA